MKRKILIVSHSVNGEISPFVYEQMNSLKRNGCETNYYGITGKGVIGYLTSLRGLKRKIREFRPDLIHAHYGLSGLLANFQRRVPVVTTYHGSDVHSGGKILKLSRKAMCLSVYNIFVSKKLLRLSGYIDDNSCVLACGVDLDAIQEIPREDARKQLSIGRDEVFGLFSGSFDNAVKNYRLARKAVDKVGDLRLMELKGYSRKEVNLLMNAAGFLLMTSINEGSPQVIKEAMACGTPIVSVDVGDVKDVIEGTEGCFLAERDPNEVADNIRKALDFKGKTKGRQRIIELGLSDEQVAKRLIGLYEEILRRRD